MANLDFKTKQIIEELFEMNTGYVINFTNSSFESFIKGTIGIDVYDGIGYEEYCSKANKLRQIFEQESNLEVAELINELVNYYENYKLKENKLTDYDKKKIEELKIAVKNLDSENEEKIYLVENLEEIIKKISTRNAEFNEMAIDEKIKEICNVLEYLLKDDKKFISLDYSAITVGFLVEEDIVNFRKEIQCFRHSSRESIKEREKYTEQQKRFMIEFGIIICNLIYNEICSN